VPAKILQIKRHVAQIAKTRLQPVINETQPKVNTGAAYTIPHIFYLSFGVLSSKIAQIFEFSLPQ